MTNAFSVLSLKRNRSTNKSFSSSHTTEPVTKLSKLKSGFSIFSRKLLSHHHDHTTNSSTKTKRSSTASILIVGLFQYFRSTEDHRISKSNSSCNSSSSTTELKRKATFDSDRNFEYNHYYNRKNVEESNIHALPITTSNSKLTSILIKRSDTNPSYPQRSVNQQKQQQQYSSSSLSKANSTMSAHRKRSWSNATISNMTINSEDLTAKEFADIAGIRILPEDGNLEEEEDDNAVRKYIDQEEDDDEDFIMNTASSRYTTPHDNRLSFISYASLASHSTSSKLKIWDNEFWLNPEVVTATTTAAASVNSRSNSANIKEMATEASNASTIPNINSLERSSSVTIATTKKVVVIDDEPPILHELRRISSEKKEHCVIKKGRFEIQLGAVAATTKDHDEEVSSGGVVLIPKENDPPSASSITSSDVNLSTTSPAATNENNADVILR